MGQELRLLIVEDSEFDAALLILELKKGDFDVTHLRVQTEGEMLTALREQSWDLIISDYSMPRFSAHAALAVAKEQTPDIPFIVVSGTVSEEVAVEVMRAGAQDFMSKSKLARLMPAIKRSMREAAGHVAHRTIERQLRQAQKMEAVGQLTGGIAHDFNNLLSVIVGNIEILLDHLEDNPEGKVLANDALNGALHGAELTRRLLAFSRQQPLSTQIVNINGVILNILTMLRRSLGERVQIVTKLEDDLWRVNIDPSQLEDAIVNLAINARDAMPDGGTMTVSTENISAATDGTTLPNGAKSGNYIRLSLKDTGTGMSADVVERAIEPFFTTKEQGKGTGLGLSMVYGFAQQSGGLLAIDSQLGSGTSINIFFPSAQADVQRTPTEQPARETLPRGGETVLLVEDNVALRRMVKGQLLGLGYHVIEAETGAAALAALTTDQKVDLLFTDIGLPGGMTGFQLVESARIQQPGLKVLYTTGYAKPDSHHDSAQSDIQYVLRKPYRRQELAEKVRAALDNAG
jgi:two-component system cell cycle sensor histidine kinase/response regulator CckA